MASGAPDALLTAVALASCVRARAGGGATSIRSCERTDDVSSQNRLVRLVRDGRVLLRRCASVRAHAAAGRVYACLWAPGPQLCVLLQSLVRKMHSDVLGLFYEMQGFCMQYLRIREAAQLFKLLRQAEETGAAGGASL